jgi:NADH dehydrogenase (ubiquinone) 1 alpha subcomplex subunit 8
MLCKAEEKDPRKCLKEGRDVTNCGLSFLQRVKKTCRDEAEAFARCTEWNDWDLWFENCRREQRVYDLCMEKKMGLPKPPFGYFTQVRVHDSKRPKPVPYVPEFPDRSKGLPVDYEGLKEQARGGTRTFWNP